MLYQYSPELKLKGNIIQSEEPWEYPKGNLSSLLLVTKTSELEKVKGNYSGVIYSNCSFCNRYMEKDQIACKCGKPRVVYNFICKHCGSEYTNKSDFLAKYCKDCGSERDVCGVFPNKEARANNVDPLAVILIYSSSLSASLKEKVNIIRE